MPDINIDELIEEAERFYMDDKTGYAQGFCGKAMKALKSLQEDNKALREVVSVRKDSEPYWQDKAVSALAEWMMQYSTIMDYKNADMVDAIKIVKGHQAQARKLLGEDK